MLRRHLKRGVEQGVVVLEFRNDEARSRRYLGCTPLVLSSPASLLEASGVPAVDPAADKRAG
jgi:hypothetical protein